MTPCIDRTIFGLELQHAAQSDDPGRALEALIRQLLVGEEIELCEEDAIAVVTAAQGIEATLRDSQKSRALARELGWLLVNQPSSRALEFIHLALEGDRIVDVVQKHLDKIISRTGWLGFISEQRWPKALRHRLTLLSSDALIAFRDALRSRNWRALQLLLFSSE